jgi:putative ABC transport system permease protein
MSWRDTFATAWVAIVTHKMRAFLTVLGILIGISAVIVTVGLGQGSEAKVTSAISSLGSNLLTVTPGASSVGGVSQGLGSASSLTLQDAKDLQSKVDCPSIKAVAPTIQKEVVMTTTSGSNYEAPVVGSTPSYFEVRDLKPLVGGFLTNQEEREGENVAVIGPEVASELFGPLDPVGQTITMNGLPFNVVGEWAEAGSSPTSTLNNQVVVPIGVAQDELVGNSVFAGNPDAVQSILLEANSQSSLGAAYQEANDLLMNLTGAESPADAPFTITPETSILSTATSVSHSLTVLLAGIAAISLLVGGIGVMNIMLVSVSERIREIGLRKALGAVPSTILKQFLLEAGMLGLIGGLVGVGLGVALAEILPHFISNPIEVTAPVLVLAVVVAVGIGVLFGSVPASRAARLSPIDALRSE